MCQYREAIVILSGTYRTLTQRKMKGVTAELFFEERNRWNRLRNVSAQSI